MKKHLIIAIVLMLLCSFSPIFAEGNTLVLNGTVQTKSKELVISEFTISCENKITNISGTIEYDAEILAIHKIDMNDDFPDWTMTFKTSEPGIIKFSGSTKKTSQAISTETKFFTVTYVVHSQKNKKTLISTKDVKAKYTSTGTETIMVVINQDDIDAANKQNEEIAEYNRTHEDQKEYVTVPDAVYQEQEVSSTVDKNITFPVAKQEVSITENFSNDSYLKELSVLNSSMSPAFSKTTYAYRVTINEKQDLVIDYKTEDPRANVSVQDEINNQVIVIVTAQDDTSSTYVLTISRQANYTNSGTNTGNAGSLTNGMILKTNTIIILAVLALLSIVGFVGGGILVSKGAHED